MKSRDSGISAKLDANREPGFLQHRCVSDKILLGSFRPRSDKVVMQSIGLNRSGVEGIPGPASHPILLKFRILDFYSTLVFRLSEQKRRGTRAALVQAGF